MQLSQSETTTFFVLHVFKELALRRKIIHFQSAHPSQCLRMSVEEESMSEKNEPNNLIPFPKKKNSEETSSTSTEEKKSKNTLSFQVIPGEGRRSINFFSFLRGHRHVQNSLVALSVILLSSFVFNKFLLNSQNTPLETVSSLIQSSSLSYRTLASIGGEIKPDPHWEEKVLKKINESSVKREMASLGYRPDLREDFLYGFLRGKFQVQFEGEKIKNISLDEHFQASSRLPYIKDPKVLFKKYAPLMVSDSVVDVVPLSSYKENDRLIESYELKNEDMESVASVTLTMDLSHRLLGLKLLDYRVEERRNN
ncbi:MAG: hypothetical protein D6797_00890 [Bdellovibrio sp.]|nr:MAG: hypothetical protein D6797_00890 [Bdellovibrio sp.]